MCGKLEPGIRMGTVYTEITLKNAADVATPDLSALSKN
jgi:hypothetical protein